MLGIRNRRLVAVLSVLLLIFTLITVPLQNIVYAEEGKIANPDDFQLAIDSYAVADNELTINWSVSHDIVAEFELSGDIKDVLSGDKRSYTHKIEPGTESINIVLHTINDDYEYSLLNRDSIELVLVGDEYIDLEEFNLSIDDYSTTSNSITINWSVSHDDAIEDFVLSVDGKEITIPGDKRSYTITELTAGEYYHIKLYANTKFDYSDSDSDWIVTEYSVEEGYIAWEDFEVVIDDYSTTSNSITIDWSVSHDAAVKDFTLDVNENKITIDADKRSYTIEGLTVGEGYSINLFANTKFGYNKYDYEWIEADWSNDEKTLVSLVIMINEDQSYNEQLKIQGLGEVANFVEYDDLYYLDDELHLPYGKYAITLYDDRDKSIAAQQTIEIKEGIDYVKNPIQLQYRLKEMREDAEPFEYMITNVTEDSFTLKWNTVSKIIDLEINASNNDDFDETKHVVNDVNEYIFTGLEANRTYGIDFLRNYIYGLNDSSYFYVKTDGDDAKAEKLSFEDKKIEKTLKEVIGLYERDITVLDMKDVEYINHNYMDTEHLEHVEYANNLKDLNAYGNNISDLTSLEKLTKLYYIDLENNDISNIDALAGLTELEYLYLRNNDLTNIDALSKLTKLSNLNLSNNKITDISELKDLQSLDSLYLYNNEITDISVIENLVNLRHLDLDGNGITDISVIENLVNLSRLDLRKNSVKDISALEDLTELEYLHLSDNSIVEIPELTNIMNLTDLNLYNNEIMDISGLTGLTKLSSLDLSDNNITDISVLKELSSLQNVYLSDNEIKAIPNLSTLTNLEHLSLYDNEITDISGLAGLTELRDLDLYNNSITDISVLKELPSLQYVYLWGNDLGEDQTETLEFLCEDGVYVSADDFDCEYGWNDWEDEDDGEDIEIDAEEVKDKFPADQGFIVSDDGKSITFDLEKSESKETAQLSTDQIELLKKNNQAVTIAKGDVKTNIPASAFGDSNEPVEINVNELVQEKDAFSSTYDFTITQGDKTISQFDDGVTLTFNVNADRSNNPHNLKVFYFNEATNKWENIGGRYDKGTGSVSVVTYHFSKFTVFEAEDDEEGNDNIVDNEGNPSKNPGETPVEDDTSTSEDDNKAPEKDDTTTPEDDNKTPEKDDTSTPEDEEKTPVGDKVTVDADSNDETETKTDEAGKKTPNTATNLYNMLAAGLIIVLIGGVALFVTRRRTRA